MRMPLVHSLYIELISLMEGFSYLLGPEETPYTPPIAEILCVKNGRAIVVCGFLMKSLKKNMLKV